MTALRKLVLVAFSMMLTAQVIRADDVDDYKYRERQREVDERYRYESWQRYQENRRILNTPDYFAAIAYSPSTGQYGYSYDYTNLAAAKQAALSRCKIPDAEVVVWAKNGYCALAAGKGTGYGGAWGATAAQARANAVVESKKHTSDSKVLVCVFSGRG
jgi:Domain of unknown function (DUF4189)